MYILARQRYPKDQVNLAIGYVTQNMEDHRNIANHLR